MEKEELVNLINITQEHIETYDTELGQAIIKLYEPIIETNPIKVNQIREQREKQYEQYLSQAGFVAGLDAFKKRLEQRIETL